MSRPDCWHFNHRSYFAWPGSFRAMLALPNSRHRHKSQEFVVPYMGHCVRCRFGLTPTELYLSHGALFVSSDPAYTGLTISILAS